MADINVCNKKYLLFFLFVLFLITLIITETARQRRLQLYDSLSRTLDQMNVSLSALEQTNKQLLQNIRILRSQIPFNESVS